MSSPIPALRILGYHGETARGTTLRFCLVPLTDARTQPSSASSTGYPSA